MPEELRVLLVEDDPFVRFATAQKLALAGVDVESFGAAEELRGRLRPWFPGILVTDLRLPGMDGLALLQEVRRIDPDLPVIIITGAGDISSAVKAMRAGAYDFIEKLDSADHLLGVVERALEKRRLIFEINDLRGKLKRREGVERLLIGDSPPMARLRQSIMNLAEAAPDVLIHGETGAGKELVARALHESSPAAAKPFVAVNCGAIPESMFESELFGHEKGAFTGAHALRVGKIEYASGGTLFLDEIESTPPALQVKLLRVLQSRQVERLGSNKPIKLAVRVVAAAKADLKALCDAGQFRSDLYFRLNVLTLDIPPLRERREDIPALFEHHVLLAASRYKREAPQAGDALMRDLIAYDWPGNVRELGNVADRFVLGVLGGRFGAGASAPGDGKTLRDMVGDFERSLIQDALRRCRGDVAEASEALGVPKKTLYDKIRRYALPEHDAEKAQSSRADITL